MTVLYIILYILQDLPDHEDKPNSSKGNLLPIVDGQVHRGPLTLHIKEQEADTLPGCPTITSLATAQIPTVCPTNMVLIPEVPQTSLIFQMIPPTQSKNEDKDNQRKIKILKMIGQNVLASTCKSQLINCRKENFPGPLSSLQSSLLDFWLSLLLRLHHSFY